MKSEDVFKFDFTDNNDVIYQFRLDKNSKEYIRILIDGKEKYEKLLQIVWNEKDSRIAVHIPTGQFKKFRQLNISYGSDNDKIYLEGEIYKTLKVVGK